MIDHDQHHSVTASAADLDVDVEIGVGPHIEAPPPARVRGRLRRLTADLLLWLGVAWLTLIVLLAVFADWLPLKPYGFATGDYLQPPHLGFSEPFGTDNLSYSITSRLVYGARQSLVIGVGAVAIGILVGGLIGLVAGYRRGRLEWFVDLCTSSLLAFPPLVLLIAVSGTLGATVGSLVLVLALLTIPAFVRITRANTLVVVQREFVEAARVQGARHTRILFREVLPNTVPAMTSYAFLVVALVIVTEGSLSFLGVGVPPPKPSWGGMIATGLPALETKPYLVLVPGSFLFLTVFSLNLVGERLRGRFDVRASNL